MAQAAIGRQLELGVSPADVGEPVHLVADDPVAITRDALDRDGVASQAGDEAVTLERRPAAASGQEQGETETEQGERGGKATHLLQLTNELEGKCQRAGRRGPALKIAASSSAAATTPRA